jgi:hypothetical protein
MNRCIGRDRWYALLTAIVLLAGARALLAGPPRGESRTSDSLLRTVDRATSDPRFRFSRAAHDTIDRRFDALERASAFFADHERVVTLNDPDLAASASARGASAKMASAGVGLLISDVIERVDSGGHLEARDLAALRAVRLQIDGLRRLVFVSARVYADPILRRRCIDALHQLDIAVDDLEVAARRFGESGK